MKRFNSIAVVPVRSLEVGDLIAREFLGSVISGKITGIAHSGYQLTDEQRAYLRKHEIEIPKGEYEPLGGASSCVIFGDFTLFGGSQKPDHMFVDYDVNVAVFPTKSN